MRRIALLTAIAVLAAGPALAKPFDARADRDTVARCFAAHMGLTPISVEVLKVKDWRPSDALSHQRYLRLKPYAEAVRKATGDFTRLAGDYGEKWEREARFKAILPGGKDRVAKEIEERSASCDAQVRAWNATKPAPRPR